MLDLCGCYTQEWSDKTGRDSAGLSQPTLDYSEDPLKPRTSLITDQTVSMLSSQPQIDGGIKTSPIWIENPPPRQENNSPSRWSRGSSFGVLKHPQTLWSQAVFVSWRGEVGQKLLVRHSGRNCEKKRKYYANDSDGNRCRKSQQIVSPDGTFPKYFRLISRIHLVKSPQKVQRYLSIDFFFLFSLNCKLGQVVKAHFKCDITHTKKDY